MKSSVDKSNRDTKDNNTGSYKTEPHVWLEDIDNIVTLNIFETSISFIVLFDQHCFCIHGGIFASDEHCLWLIDWSRASHFNLDLVLEILL